MLRMESASQEIDGRPIPNLDDESRPKFRAAFGELSMLAMSLTVQLLTIIDMTRLWIDDNLEIYKV